MEENHVIEPSSVELEFTNAKAYLLTRSDRSGHNLYDHLSKVLTKVLDERPTNAVDIFEDLSKETKRTKFTSNADTVQDKIDKSTEVALCQIQEPLFKRSEIEEEPDAKDDDVETPLPNLMELSFYFEQAGIGINREECYRIWLALKQLVDSCPLQHVRLWGKILGTEQNYYVAEVEYRDGDDEEEEEENQGYGEAEEAEESEDGNDDDENREYDEVPKPAWKPPPIVPMEEPRSGANKKTYFVCNEPGKPWKKLPHVTPQQITVARQIKKFLTGRLDAYIVSYPPFPGIEANYLRAQIARISAGSHISPLDYYQFDDEEESDYDDDQRENFVENLDFEEIPVKSLCDPSNWVHHVQHILPQGRCAWWNPTDEGANEEEEGDEDEEREEEVDEPEPEVGPPLLTPLSEDADIDGMPPWSPTLSTNIIPQYAVAVLKSNLWPGAYAFCFEKKFENIYLGWGHKYSEFNPHTSLATMQEYESGPEVTEVEDPPVEEEIALRDARDEARRAEEMFGEEGDEEEEETPR